jgi:hypothetical protein
MRILICVEIHSTQRQGDTELRGGRDVDGDPVWTVLGLTDGC